MLLPRELHPLFYNFQMVATPEKQRNADVDEENVAGEYKPLSIQRRKRPEPRDVSDITVRILNYLSALGRDLRDDDSLAFELQRLLIVHKILNRSGYYYGRISYDRAEALLATRPIGTFLVRDSHHPNHLYSLSYRDLFGTLHIRIRFQLGLFTLYDDFERFGDLSYGFEGVVDLVEHYIHRAPVNRMFAFGRPAYCEVPGLRHLCLRRVAKALKGSGRAMSVVVVRDLGLTRELEEEVKEYAFPLECVRERLRADAERGM